MFLTLSSSRTELNDAGKSYGIEPIETTLGYFIDVTKLVPILQEALGEQSSKIVRFVTRCMSPPLFCGADPAGRVVLDGSSYFRHSKTSLVSFKFIDPRRGIPTKEFPIAAAPEGESYEVWKDILTPVVEAFKQLKREGILTHVIYTADLKALLCCLGRLSANSLEPCPFCDFKMRTELRGPWTVSNSVVAQSFLTVLQKLTMAMMTERARQSEISCDTALLLIPV